MPDITIIIGVLYTIQNLFYRIELVRTKHHQALVSFMQYDIFSYDFAKVTFFQEEYGKFIQFIERMIGCIRPIECKLISTIGIIGKIASIYTVGNDKQLYIIKQPVKRSLVVALYLVIRLFKLHSTTLQFNLHQRQTINQKSHIITAFFASFRCDLVGNLELILTPLLPIQKFHPYTLPISHFKRI